MLTIAQAAQQFNVTRAKIYRAIERGDLTPQLNDDGVKVIDPADMVRLFGGKSSTRRTTPNKSADANAQQSEQIVEMLLEQLKQAQEREQFYKSEIANIRKDFEDFKRLLPLKTPLPQSEQPEKSEQVKPDRSDETTEQQGIACNDRGSEIEKPKRGILGRVFGSVFEG